jgi:hypothetical protein
MRTLLSLTLVTLATLAGCAAKPAGWEYTLTQPSGGPNCQRLAKPGDAKIQIYCKTRRPESVWPIEKALSELLRPIPSTGAATQASGETRCRRVSLTSDKKVETSCGTSAQWDEFDSWAVNAGVTCRWPVTLRGKISQELCLSVAQWGRYDASRRRAVANGGSNWPGSGVSSGASVPSYATSYGYSSTGVIGQ